MEERTMKFNKERRIRAVLKISLFVRVANKTKPWYNETGGSGSDLPYTCINLQAKLS